MSKLLRYLLEAEEPLFTQSLRELEFLTHKKGIDVKLTADILEQTHAGIRGLGLDSNDTTDKELFYALRDRVHEHNAHLATGLGVGVNSSAATIATKLIEVVVASEVPKKVWALKRSVAKDLLRDMPPKNLMRHLRYRSVESMFKNENFSELYVALKCSETDEWLQQFNQLFAGRVQPSDFENRAIDIVQFDHDKWASLAKNHIENKLHPVMHTKELAVVAVAPLEPRDTKGMILRVLPLLFHYINEIRLYAVFFKLKSTDPQFSNVITKTLTSDNETGASIANFHIHWRVIQRHFSEFEDVPELFQPHIQPEDLLWHKTEDLLFKLSSELKYWQGMEYVAQHGDDGLPVSFNLIDAALNYACDVPFEQRSVRHFQNSLWNELFIRYMGEETLKKHVLDQLDNPMIAPEALSGK